MDLTIKNVNLMSIKTLRDFAKRFKKSGVLQGAISKLSRNQLINKLTPFQSEIDDTIERERDNRRIESTLPQTKQALVKLAKDLKSDGFIKGGITTLTREELKEKIIPGEKIKRSQQVNIDNPTKEFSIKAKKPIVNKPNQNLFGEQANSLKQVIVELEDGEGAVIGRQANNMVLLNAPTFIKEFDDVTLMDFIVENIDEFKEDFTKVGITLSGMFENGKDKNGNKKWMEYSEVISEEFLDVNIDEETLFGFVQGALNKYNNYEVYVTKFKLAFAKPEQLEAQGGGCNTKSHKSSNFSPVGWAKVCDPPAKENNCGIRCIIEYLKRNKLINAKKVNCNTTRDKFGLKRGSILKPEQLSKITNHYEVNLIVYNFKKEIIFQTQGFEHTCELLLTLCDKMFDEKPKHSVDECAHYVLVTDSNYYKDIICEHCLNKLPRKAEERATHVCDPNVLSYVNTFKKEENVEAGLKFMYSKGDGKGKKELVELDRCHVFDFETFVKIGEYLHNVYAYGIYNSVTGYQEDYGENSMDSFIEHILNIEPVYEESKKKVEAEYNESGEIVTPAHEKTIYKKKPQYAIAFNGSKFDFHCVIGELTKREIEIEDFIMNNSAILGFTIKKNNLRFWDINRHISGSLNKALKNFDCKTQKGDFNHFKVTSWEDVEKYKDEWKPYLKSDVMGLTQLTEKYSKTVWDLFRRREGLEHVRIDPKEYLTLPSAGYKIWQKTLFNKKRKAIKRAPYVEIPNNDRDIKDHRSSSYGGRTYPLQRSYESKHFKQIKELWERQKKAKERTKIWIEEQKQGMTEKEKEEFEKWLEDQKQGVTEEEKGLFKEGREIYNHMDDYIFNGDITSLYSTAMYYYEYPRGYSTRIEDEENPEKTKKELMRKLNNRESLDYLCTLKVKLKNENSDLVVAPLPKPKVENERRVGVTWDIKNGDGLWYTSVDLEIGIEFGYQIEEIYDGMLYKDGTQELFKDYVEIFINIKNEQDKLKKSKSKDYNPAMRAVAKLFLNSLYGKTLQKPIYDSTQICKSANDIFTFWEKHKVKDCTISEDGETIFLQGEKNKREKCNTKPNQLGAFLLSYSRRIMIEVIKAINPTLDLHCFTYGDTDSLHIHSSYLEKLKNKINPVTGRYWLEPGLGSLSNDIDNNGLIVRELNYAPKNYYYVYIDENGKIDSSHKCKGIVNEYLDEDGKKKKNLNDELYEEGESKTINMKKRIKKVGFKPNNVQRQKGLSNFDIISIDMERTWNCEWETDRLINNKYFPYGHQIFNQESLI
jgi:hypothetical protein